MRHDGWSREWPAVCAAALLHAGGLLAPALIGTRAPAVALSSARLRADIEVDLLVDPTPPREAASVPPPEAREEPETPREVPRPVAAASRAAVATATESVGAPSSEAAGAASPSPPEAAPPGTAAAPPPAAPPDEYSPTPEVTVPGLGGAPIWAVPGAVAAAAPRPAATAPDLPRAVDRDVAGKVIEGTLRKKDQELGLEVPSAGVVAGAVADAVRGVETTGDQKATFEVSLGAQGDVRGVRVVSFSAGDAGNWDRAAKRAAASLGGRGLSTNGEPVTVVVKVESSQRYPAGSKEKIDARPVCVNEVIEEVALALQEVAGGPTDPVAPKPATIDPRRRFCIPVGIAGTGDASNIAAHKQTVVRSSFKVVRTGDRNLPSDRAKPVDTRAPWLEARDETAKRTDPQWKDRKKTKKKKKQ